MQATTIKLDPKLHSAIRRLKTPKQTLTGYVRDLVVREEKRAEFESAAKAYAALVSSDEEESRWLAEWASTPLANPPKRRRK